MKLTQTRWQQIETILDELLDLPPYQRAHVLQQRCHNDVPLYDDIASLLWSSEQGGNILDQNALSFIKTLFERNGDRILSLSTENSLSGQQIGAFILDQEIGRGGMGVVYKGRRVVGDFDQIVAIKILLHSDLAVTARFHREQQALASLIHPNITQLYDGGISAQGYPYLVMEFIDGLTITEYCEKNRLSLPQRLALLDQVIAALAYSHKNLIVHRDIKPSNILVTTDGQVKLLDFSIAKLLDATLYADLTSTQVHLLTPNYSAPEQVLNHPITVATDIYQLGLLFYRLLTGHPAFLAEVGSLQELVKVICQQDVIKPSQVLKKTAFAQEILAKPREALGFLRGDLDAIILKMLRKEATARYDSITSLKADLDAFRQSRPVAARKAAFSYHAGKYFRRNWRTVIFTAISAIFLIGYAVTVTVQNKRISQSLAKSELEQRKAEQVAQFLSETFKAADPSKGGLGAVTAQDLLERAQVRIDEELSDAPEIKAALLNIFGKIYYRQQEYQKAHDLLVKFFVNNKIEDTINPQLLAETKLMLAQQKIGLGEYEEATTLLRQCLSIQNEVPNFTTTNKALYGETLAFLGLAHLRQQQFDTARAEIADAIHNLQRLGSEGDRIRSFALNILANDQFIHNQLDLAIDNMRESVRIKKQVLGEDHTETSRAQLGLVNMLLERNNIDEAKALALDAAGTITRQLPPDHPYQLTALTTLAKLEQRFGNLDKAEALLKKNFLKPEINKESYSFISNGLLYLDILIEQGKLEQSAALLAELEALMQTRNTDKDLWVRLTHAKGRLSLIQGDYAAALNFFHSARSGLDAEQIQAQMVQRDGAVALLSLQRFAEAQAELLPILAHLKQRYQSNHPQVQLTCWLISFANQVLMNASADIAACGPKVEPLTFYVPNYLKVFTEVKPSEQQSKL